MTKSDQVPKMDMSATSYFLRSLGMSELEVRNFISEIAKATANGKLDFNIKDHPELAKIIENQLERPRRDDSQIHLISPDA